MSQQNTQRDKKRHTRRPVTRKDVQLQHLPENIVNNWHRRATMIEAKRFSERLTVGVSALEDFIDNLLSLSLRPRVGWGLWGE